MPPSSTSSSEARSAARFLLAAAALFVACLAGFELVFYRFGDNLPYARVVELQQRERLLYAQGFFNAGIEYKMLGAEAVRPEILALGASRILQLRSGDIPSGRRFYNAGLTSPMAHGLDGMIEILRGLPEDALPRTVLVEFDPWLFNPNYSANRSRAGDRALRRLAERSTVLPKLVRAYQSVVWRFESYETLIRYRRNWIKYLFLPTPGPGIGLEARVLGAGFEADGSYRYPEEYGRAEKELSPEEWRTWMGGSVGGDMFPEADGLDRPTLDKLERFLALARERRVRVVGVLPPFRPDLYAALQALPDRRAFLDGFRRAVPETLRRNGFPCFDFSAPDSIGASSAEFLDWAHARESVWKRIVSRAQNELRAGMDTARINPL